MVKILIGMVVALAALLLLNYVIKKTDTYNWIVAVVGSIIALLNGNDTILSYISA